MTPDTAVQRNHCPLLTAACRATAGPPEQGRTITTKFGEGIAGVVAQNGASCHSVNASIECCRCRNPAPGIAVPCPWLVTPPRSGSAVLSQDHQHYKGANLVCTRAQHILVAATQLLLLLSLLLLRLLSCRAMQAG